MRCRCYKIRMLAAAAAAAVLLAACGAPAQDKLDQAVSVRAEIESMQAEAAALSEDLGEDSFAEKLLQLDEITAPLLTEEPDRLSGRKMDEYLSTLQQTEDNYRALRDEMKQAVEDRGPKMTEIPVTLVNHTGLAVAALYLYPDGSDDKGENLVEGMEPLQADESLTGLNFYIEEDGDPEDSWSLEAVGEGGEEMTIDGLKLRQESGWLMLTLTYDSVTGEAAFDEEDTTQETDEDTSQNT